MLSASTKKNWFRQHQNLLITTGFCLVLFTVSLIVRLYKTETFLDIDGTAYWFKRCHNFIQAVFVDHNFKNTLQAPHPGVTLMWLSGLSLAFVVAFLSSKNGQMIDFAASNYRPEMIFAAKLPIAIVTSLFLVFVYLLVKKHWGQKRAILAALLLLLDPLFLGHSRYFQLDGLAAAFAFLALLLILAYLEKQTKFYLYASAISIALGLLTKSYTAIVFVLIVALLIYKKKYREIGLWIIFAGLTFFILWPSMWVQPLHTVNFYIQGITKANGVGNIGKDLTFYTVFQEKLYYPLYLITRLAPLVLLISLYFLTTLRKKVVEFKMPRLLLLVAVLFFIIMIGTSQQHGRYTLTTFLALDTITAFTLVYLFELRPKFKKIMGGIIAFFILCQTFAIISFQPYYGLYHNFLFNPLVNSNRFTSEFNQLGWGDGIDQACNWINQQPNATQAIVASWYPAVAKSFCHTKKVTDLNKYQEADYLILYENQVKRPKMFRQMTSFIKEKNLQPVYILKVRDQEIAWVYKTK